MSSLPRDLAVSLSGEGHRATGFVLGALMRLSTVLVCLVSRDPQARFPLTPD